MWSKIEKAKETKREKEKEILEFEGKGNRGRGVLIYCWEKFSL